MDNILEGQTTLFDFISNTVPKFHIDKPIKVIELFGGIGSQLMAFERIHSMYPTFDFESHMLVEYDKYPVKSFNAIHNCKYEPMDITKVKGGDLGIVDTNKWTYIMTYSFPCQ